MRQTLGEKNFDRLPGDLTNKVARQKVEAFVGISPLVCSDHPHDLHPDSRRPDLEQKPYRDRYYSKNGKFSSKQSDTVLNTIFRLVSHYL